MQTWVLPAAGLALAAAVALGLCAPWVALRTERRATTALADGRREVASRVLLLFEAAAELLAYGKDRDHRLALTEADTQLVGQARRQAFGAGAAEALITLACGAGAVVSTALAAQAVAAGSLDAVLAPLLALVPLALAEVLALLPPAAQHWDTLQRARHRLWSTHRPRPSPRAAYWTRSRASALVRWAKLGSAVCRMRLRPGSASRSWVRAVARRSRLGAAS